MTTDDEAWQIRTIARILTSDRVRGTMRGYLAAPHPRDAYDPRHQDGARLVCDSCEREHPGRFTTYEAWEDAARAAGWFVGEDLVLCDRCSAEP